MLDVLLSVQAVPTAPKSEGTAASVPNPQFTPEKKREPNYQVELDYTAVLVPDSERPPGFESNTRSINVWLKGDDQILSQVDRVTYFLHPTFNPSVVTRYSAEDKFKLSFSAWGQFELKTKVYFRDGKVRDVSRYLSFY